jgi:NhaA family Na+:H+ antiporter
MNPDVPPLDRHSTLAKILHHQAIGAVFLLIAAATAMICANLHFSVGGRTIAQWYSWLWHQELGVYLGDYASIQPLHVWINDGLMAIFFLMVGLEIKRELLIGELASIRKAALPIMAAVGGMIFPAVLFAAINWGGPGLQGWGIPMATDIAFAAGVIGLLSHRVPSGLAVFLIALAIVDDLGAVLVIALFYTDSIDALSLQAGLGLIALSCVLAWLGVRSAALFTILAILSWVSFLNSGVHATIAGVLFALTIPVDARYDTPLFVERIRELLQRFSEVEDHLHPRMVNARQQRLIRAIESECILVEAPLQRIENKLHPWIAFLVMPLFAFSNSGVELSGTELSEVLRQPVAIGVIVGLLVGKQLGIMAFSVLAVRLRLAELPEGVRWRHIYGVSWLAAIGFTMSLFIAELAFQSGDGGHLAAGEGLEVDRLMAAKVGILMASVIAGCVGACILWWTSRDGNQRVFFDRNGH